MSEDTQDYDRRLATGFRMLEDDFGTQEGDELLLRPDLADDDD